MRAKGLRERAVRRAVARIGLAALLTGGASVMAREPSRAQPPGKQLSATRFDWLWPRAEFVRFEATTLEERVAFEKLLPMLLRAAPQTDRVPEGAVSIADSVDFLLETWRFEGDTFWVLREKPGHFRGAGAYVIRTGVATEDFLQAPHAYFDLGTGDIGASLFLHAPAGRRPRLFATNTAHRYRSRTGEERGDREHPADVAHNAEHLFTWVTHLVARELPEVRVLQLHGFGKADHPARRGIGAVLSTGSHRAPSWIRVVAGQLTPAVGSGVRIFPEQTSILGGTRNAQAKLLQHYPRARFLHLELSAPLRESLADDGQLRRFSKALFAPGEE